MASTPLPQQTGAAPLRILLVEDDADDAALMHAYLAEATSEGAEVLHVRSLGEALRVLRAQPVQLTLLDLDLPDSLGFQTLERMRAVAAGPIVVVSGNGHPSLVDEVLKRRAFDVIPKQELDAATLRRILRLASLQQETGRALRATEGRFRALLENSAEAVALLDAAGRIEYASASMRRVLGFESHEVTGRVSLEFVHPEDRGAVHAAFRRLHAAGPGARETLRVRYPHKDGSLRLLESTAVNRLADPDVAAIVCNFRDLTLEADLEARFRATFEHAAVGLAQLDAQGRIVLANERLCAILGYARAELLGMSFRDLSHPEDRDVSAPLRARMYAGGIKQFRLRKRYLRKDGATVWVQITAALVRSAGGEPHYEITAFEDISESVRIENELRQSERRFRGLIENSADGIVMVDEAGSIRYASPATSRMLGYEESELVGREGVELVHPEDAPSFLRDLEAVRLNAARSFDARARARHKDGSYRLLEGTWTNLLGEPGVSALVANFRDVTERERSLQALAEAEERYRNLSESSPDAILVHAFGEVLYANAACVSLLGAAMAEQIVGRSIWSLVDQRDHELTRARLRALAEGEHQPTSQLRWLRMDGSAVDLEVAATPINYEGRPAVQAVARDITGRLQQEQALRTAQARSERLSRMYAALSATNEEILKTSSPEALYRRLCELLVEHGGLRLAAVRLVERETGWIESVAHAGGPASYLAQARIAIDRNRPQAQGPSVRVVLDGCTLVNNDYLADPTLALWHGPAREAGIAAMMSVPLRRGGEVIGLLSLYAGEAGWFDPELVGLAERMAGNVSFALDGFEREAKRAATERRVRLEHEVTRMLAEADSASEGLRAVMRAVCEAEDWDCARYFAIDGEAGLMRIVECWGVEDPGVQGFLRASAGQAMALGEGLAGRVWESGAPLWVADAVSDPRVSAQGRAIIGEICKALVLPVHAQSRTIGVLAISGRQIREPEPALLQSLGTIADQVGQFLRRKTAERATRESEERFRSLTELSADWYWEQDAQFRFTAVAGAGAIAMTNGSTAPYLGKTRWETPDLEPYEGDWQAHRAQLERRESFHDLVLRRRFADGTSGYMSVSGEPVFDAEGRFAGYRGVAKNVTDKVRAALALRESEARFRSLTGLSSDWYWEQDAELRFVSTGGVDKLRGGITAAQHEGLRRWELPGTEALAGSWDEHKAVLAARLPFRDFMLRRTAADGTVHYISVSGEPIFGEGGSFRGYRGVAKDVTASHLAVLAVRESEERFRNLSGLSSDWYWEQDAEFRFTRTTVDRGSPVFGEPTVTLGKARWELPLTPLSCGWEQHRETLRAHRTFREFEYSYADAKGEPRYVSASGYPVFDEAGRFTGYRGIARDITERKHAEQRMALHAERQEAIARFGQYALGRRTVDELYAEAARTLRGGDVDAACALELMADGARYLVRAADGAGAQRTLGMVASIAPDSLLPATLRENAPRIIDEDFLARRPVDGPGREWLHAMKSALYIPVRAEDNPASALSMYSRRAKAFGDDDVRFAEAVAHVLSTALQRHRAEQRLAHLAQFDGLTGLPNRTLLQDRFAQALLQSQRRQVHAGVLFVDLDRFKLINDTLGHHQGDALIRQVGERLVACVRPGDTVGRISGDEFAVVLADLARPDDASIVAQKALDALAKPFDLGGNEAYVTASIGIAVYPADGEDAETLLKSADMAMYRAKESARNSYCFFTAEMNQRSVAKVQLNTDLRRALERDEFTLHYQPKVDLASGKLRGMEALLRWKHPSRGLVSPGEFIPALEDSGLILPVGEWVIEEACRQVLRWTEGGAMPVPIAVNLSPKQFRRRDLDALIRAALVRTGVSAEFLELEITESCLMENPEDAVRALRNLRAAGLRISVDDFGTGYSSLSYLTRLPLSALKIDRSFVRDAESSAEAASIVRAVIDMAQNLRLTVIAEGVETEQQAAFLRRHGCDQAQGYFYGRPVPADEITPRLARP